MSRYDEPSGNLRPEMSVDTPLSEHFKAEPPSRILFYLHPTIGDVVMLTAAMRWVRRRFPACWIVVATSETSRPIMQGCPAVDEVWDRPRSGIGSRLAFVSRVRAAKFDLGVTMYAHNQGIRLMKLGGVKAIAGVLGSKYRNAYIDSVIPEPDEHATLGPISRLLARLGCDTSDWQPKFNIPAEVEQKIDTLNLPSRFIAIQVGASHPNKRWSIGSFMKVANDLETDGMQVIFIGGPNESQLMKESKPPASSVSLAGQLTVMESAEVIRRAQLLITNDSGPMHIASAFSTPIVGLYGPTSPKQYAPFGTGHTLVFAGCQDCPRSIEGCRGDCWTAIRSEQVMAAVHATLSPVKAL